MGILSKLAKIHHIDSEKSMLLLKNSNYRITKVRYYKDLIFINAIRESVGIIHFIAIFKDRTIDRISSHQKCIPKNIFKKDFYSEHGEDCFFNIGAIK